MKITLTSISINHYSYLGPSLAKVWLFQNGPLVLLHVSMGVPLFPLAGHAASVIGVSTAFMF